MKRVAEMKLLGCKLSDDGGHSAELDFKIDKATKAFYANAKQLKCKSVSIYVRVRLLRILVAQVLLHGMETLAITRALLDRVDGFYSGLVCIMMGFKRRPDETLQEYIHRKRSAAKRVLTTTTGTASFMLCAKAWRYYGH
eukprot:7451703-Karenia_brevis.AAC.1